MKSGKNSKRENGLITLAAVLFLAASIACAPYAAWADDHPATGQTDVTVVQPAEDNIQETVATKGDAGTQKVSALPKTGDGGLAIAVCVSTAFVLFSAAAAGIALRSGSNRGTKESGKEVLHGKE